MFSKKQAIRILFVFAALFLYGILHLLFMRFGAGDIYPAYSSLRSDPLGTKILYDSFSRMDALRVDRLYAPLQTFQDSPDTCLIFLGIKSPGDFLVPRKWLDQFNRVLNSGARIVIALAPDDPGRNRKHSGPMAVETDDVPPQESDVPPEDADGSSDRDPFETPPVNLLAYLGVAVEHETKGSSKHALAHPGESSDNPADLVPVTFPFSKWFQLENTEWQVMYSVDQFPVVIEKKHSGGSVVLVADSYVFSNEALWRYQNAAFLSRVCNRSRIVFDEYHFGIRKQPGVSTLIRKYHLYGLAVAVIGFIILFMWKNASCFIPPDVEKEMDDLAADMPDKDTLSGMAGLLRQHIGPDQILDQCIREFKESFAHGRHVPEKYNIMYDQIIRMTTSSGSKTDPVIAYQNIHRIIAEGNRHER